MAGDVRRITLGEAADLLTGFPFKSAEFSDDPKDIRLLRGDNVVQGQTRWDGVKRWPNVDIDSYCEYLLRPGDVVLAMDRPWIEAGLKHATLTKADCPSLLVQRVARLRARSDVDQRFLGYVVRSSDFTNYVLAVQTGTAVPHISSGQIKSYEFLVPPLEEQQRAANLLGTLDDKIELNRRIAETLEATARALFKSWFVDFDPVRTKLQGQPGGLPDDLAVLFPDRFKDERTPDSWRSAPIVECFDLLGGGTPKTSVPEYWDGHIPWFSVVDAPLESAPFVLATERLITQLGLENCASELFPLGTTIITARGTVGKLAIVGVPMAMNQSCYAAVPKAGYSAYFNYFAIRHVIEDLKTKSHGSVFSTITRQTFDSTIITLPPPILAKAYDHLTGPLMNRIKLHLEQSRTLAALRDALLPKLISGELRMADAEKRIVAA